MFASRRNPGVTPGLPARPPPPLADAGQNADDKLLRGWLDVDEFYGTAPPPPPGAVAR